MNSPIEPAAPMVPPAVKGAVKSKTMWAAGIFATVCELEPLIEPLWTALIPALHLDPTTVRVVGAVAGLLMGYMRTITSSSLAEKGVPSPPMAG